MKGVTTTHTLFDELENISIHTPVKGVTMYGDGGYNLVGISIHTPVKGVTVSQGGILHTTEDFKPHTL